MTLIAYFHGEYDDYVGKFLNALVRYRRSELAAVVAFQPAASLAAYAARHALPMIDTAEQLPADCRRMVIATMRLPRGEQLDALLRFARAATTRGVRIQNGTHERLGAAAPELAAMVEELRTSARPQRLYADELQARRGQLRVLTVGMDSNIGKMTASLELERALVGRGVPARFVATGQIGIALSGAGVPLDATIADFTAGVIEEHLLSLDDRVLLIEGQGGIFNPLFSGVTLSLLHGSVPHQMILCGDLARRHPRGAPSVALPDLADAVALYERLAQVVQRDALVVGVSVITAALPEDAARAAVHELGERLGLPATDALRFGVEPLLEPIVRAAGNHVA